jgi:hypothetical protein
MGGVDLSKQLCLLVTTCESETLCLAAALAWITHITTCCTRYVRNALYHALPNPVRYAVQALNGSTTASGYHPLSATQPQSQRSPVSKKSPCAKHHCTRPTWDPIATSRNCGFSAMLVSLTVGKVDAGVTVLLTPDKRLVGVLLESSLRAACHSSTRSLSSSQRSRRASTEQSFSQSTV